ncbi:hypothetical protein EVAR_59023_1 [Eumeta japonica]|uniref:Uncharacterized protein n=1 Tax=Eumeta variegata TaxID=151549 RepID=A0A4C1ZK66_EUMVA|nr:hypothetical protein EVAR_59023_1 [Eumeta japonica]
MGMFPKLRIKKKEVQKKKRYYKIISRLITYELVRMALQVKADERKSIHWPKARGRNVAINQPHVEQQHCTTCAQRNTPPAAVRNFEAIPDMRILPRYA